MTARKKVPSKNNTDKPLIPVGVTELKVSQLRWSCGNNEIRLGEGRKASSDVGTVGQDRALDALRMCVSLDSPGYNAYVCGDPGTGRTSAVKAVLKGISPAWSKLWDRCYVYNFKDPDRPRLLALEPGKGRKLKKAMTKLVSDLLTSLPRAFETTTFRKEKEDYIARFKSKDKELWTKFEQQVRKKNFVVVQLQEGPVTRQDVLPVIDGKPCTSAQLSQLVEQGRLEGKDIEKLTGIYMKFQPKLRALVKKSRELERELIYKLEKLETTSAEEVIEELQAPLRKEFQEKEVLEYLDEVADSFIDDLDVFTSDSEEDEEHEAGDGRGRQRSPFMPYEVNLVLDNSETKEAPVVMETSPTFSNLFGSIERIERNGVWRSDFTGIRGGSLLRADGGFLVLNVIDVLSDVRIWVMLKRMLKNRKLEIQEPEFMSPSAPTALKPEPISLKLKVIMIGQAYYYHMMTALDEDFAKIFKIKSEFDSEMNVSQDNLDHFVGVVEKITKEENLVHFTKKSLGRLAEYAVRMAGEQGKLTTRFSEVANLMRESSYWAHEMKKKTIDEKVLSRAILERNRRHNLAEEKMQESMDTGMYLIDVTGKRVGQINGLAVYTLGHHVFGRPSRITATVGVGRSGIINVERESELSGTSHTKGVLILSGFIRQRFGQEFPLSVDASLCFEQSYGGVDGDSASSTEIYALMSALSELPLRQDIAVTGSVNQMGDIQPIGGVNEKIEGFFASCKARKLTGTQGVMIPHQNVQNLMLNLEIVEAVEAGKFHIYPIKTVDQGVALLTGVTAGKRNKAGKYPEDSVNGLVEASLLRMATKLRKFYSGSLDID
jgi:ATP-dependent Lon protease